ncbi:Ig-like domain-containing protein [Limnoraphis robusta]|uniref:Ig-like domain-containing protein n=1 Tax=Limnoraphis robusta CCNP1315 TaxID=3110306 RepID=A0ABU5U115_9CYAN|nr:Ig-like domain-containing protein [Limnoraphis robusta]MEA5520611.1 Ig-like domain-containing protein [Limnoraphis robusta CCNP1315]
MMFSESGNTQASYSTISQLLGKNPEYFKKSPETYSSISIAARKTEVIVIVDAQVEDYEKLLKGIVPRVKVILLDSTENGVKQITQALGEYKDLCEIHIISHGSPGCLQLGNTQLSLDTLNLYANSLQTWCANSLLLYGCNVAAGDAGIEFIEKLHQITGAKIAASANKTGNAALGGDWNLEVKTDEFDVTLALTSEAIANYNYTLPLPISNLNTEPLEAPDSTITSGTVTYNFGVGSNLQITSFEDESGIQFLSAGRLDEFELKRLPNNQVQGDRQIIWYEQGGNSNSTTINLAPNQAESTTDQEAMEIALFSEIINRGTDNIFANQDNGDGNINNIERVDYISTRGLTIPESNLDGIGFLILERGGNDYFKIAAITGLDSNTGEPTAFGPLLSFAGGDWGESDTGFSTRVLRQEEGQDSIASTQISEQNIAGIFISYEDLLGENAGGNEFFGYALFPPDIDQDNDLVGLTNFPTTTSDNRGPADPLGGGLDLVGGGVVYRRKDVNFPPVAGDDTATTDAGIPVPINVLENDNDPGNNSPEPLSIADITQPANGTATLDDNQIIYTPNPGFSGEDTFVYTITDGQDTTTATVTVTVNRPANQPPNAVDDPATTNAQTLVAIDVLANDTDLDLGPAPLSIADITEPVNGTAVLNNNGTINYTPNPGFSGTETFTYTITDGEDTDTATVTVTVNAPGNQPPIAVDDPDNTTEGTPVPINVLENDTDPDNSPEPLSIADITQPANGTAVLNNNGTINYTPNPGFSGTETFTYTITDGEDTDTATVTVTVNAPGNQPPIAVDDSATTGFNRPITLNVLGNDTDPEGNSLSIADIQQDTDNGGQVVIENGQLIYTPPAGFTGNDSFSYTISDGQGGTDTATVTITVEEPANTAPDAVNDERSTRSDTAITINVLGNDSDPENDPLEISSFEATSTNGATITRSQNAQALVYTPPAGFSGTDSFTYTISDGQGGTDTATVTINVETDQTLIAANDTATTDQDTNVTINVLANDVDPENDPLEISTFEATSANGGTITRSENGEALVYTPPAGFSGTDSFTYEVTDGSNSDTATVTITVNPPTNTKPAAIDDERRTDVNTAVTINVLTNDTDPENDPLNIESFDEISANGGTITASEDGQSLIYTPANRFVGTDTFTYTINDGRGGTDIATVTINVSDQGLRPEAVDDSATTPQDTNVSINVIANDIDPDGDPLNIESFDGISANGGTITASEDGQSLIYTPARGFSGIDTFVYQVSDGTNTDIARVTVTVEPPANVPPTATDESLNTPFETPVTFNLADNISDPDGNVELSTIDLDPTTPEIDQQVTLPQGRFSVNNQGQVTFEPVDGFSGSVTIPFTVQDNLGATSEPANILVTVSPDANQPPTAEDVQSSSILNNSAAIPLPLSAANFSDPDGIVELINLTLPNPAEGTLLLDGVAVSDPIQVQRLTPNQLDNLTFRPNIGFAGNASFSYTVTDDDGANSNIANITVPVIAFSVPNVPGGGGVPSLPSGNLPPEAENETANIPNDGTPSVIPPLTAIDRDGSVNFYTITELPANGTLFLNGEEITSLDQVERLTPSQAGQLTFEPDSNFTGDVSFTFTATDNDGAVSNIATVRLIVEEDDSIPRGEVIDDGGCDCPPLPEFGTVPLPERLGLTPSAFNGLGSIDGTDESDTIPGSLGSDLVFAFAGDDRIEGFEGNDTVYGGEGDDLKFGDEGNDSLLGGDGNDTLIGSNGSEDLAASPNFENDDFLYGHANNDLIQGGPGADMIYSGKQDDFSYGGKNDDMVWGDLGNDTLYGDQGNDTLVGDTVDENEVEPERALSGMIDFIWGGAGDDLINGGRSNDTLSGGVGNDTVRGGKEDDLVYGEAGDDLMYGDLGNDHLCGNEGNDTIYGDINDNETFTQSPGRDTICGGSGSDLLFGNEDNDRLCGGTESDTLYGGLGEDTLAGELGDDWLFGDEGNDLISGGSGSDRFILFSDSGTDTIQDFQLGTDFIALGGGLSFDDLTLSQSGTTTVISLDSQQLAILNDIQVTALTESSFIAFVG